MLQHMNIKSVNVDSESEDAESSEKCRVWLAGHCAATEAQAANILILEARQYVEVSIKHIDCPSGIFKCRDTEHLNNIE